MRTMKQSETVCCLDNHHAYIQLNWFESLGLRDLLRKLRNIPSAYVSLNDSTFAHSQGTVDSDNLECGIAAQKRFAQLLRMPTFKVCCSVRQAKAVRPSSHYAQG